MAEQVHVPADHAGSEEFVRFAHTYNGYELHGSLEALAVIVQSVQHRWQQTGELGEDVDELRACLFYEVRAHRFGGGYGRFERQPFAAALTTRIRLLSGGLVPIKGTVP
jgi:hypothetical protein